MSTPPDSRDIILAKREGYVAAKVEHFGQPLENWHLYAKRAFPLPLRQEPREIAEDDPIMLFWRWRVMNGCLQRSSPYTQAWEGVAGASCTAAIAELIANPTREVPDDG